MRIVAADIEANGWQDNATEIWLFGGIDVNTGETWEFQPWRSSTEKEKAINWAKTVDLWVGHNFLSYDAPVLNRLLCGGLIPYDRIVDTLIVSRTVKYDRYTPKGCKSGHSLKAHGIRLGIHKGDFDKFDEYSEEMREYWLQDLQVQLALYRDLKRFIFDPEWKKAFRVEHDIQLSLDRQTAYGFDFDSHRAEQLRSSILQRMAQLEDEIQEDYPPQLEHVNTINYLIKKDGTEGHHVQEARKKYPMVNIRGDKLECYDYVKFNPGSPKDRIEKLWEAGWKPFEKTKTHQQFLRTKPGQPWGKAVRKMTQEFWDDKKAHFDYYGWTCSEDNLSTLPETAPQAARKLAQWLTLEGRRSSLVEWLGQVKEDGRIHGSVMHIGAWTGRMSHSNPNTANISSVWPEGKEPRNAVEETKKQYDTAMRACWKVPEGSWLVGVDADGIQLRVLADYLWRHCGSDAYARAILSGRKDDGTDIHNVNRKALRLGHLTRDDAKTFIYAWVLNAGIPKVASILRTDIPTASASRDRFESSIGGLKRLKGEILPFIADRGWFSGYDGRKVIVPNLHKTLAGILQNGEAVVMKHARLRWEKQLNSDGINYKPVGLIHDEFQTEVIGTREEAEHVKLAQMDAIRQTGEDLGFLIELAGSGSIGKSWAETH